MKNWKWKEKKKRKKNSIDIHEMHFRSITAERKWRKQKRNQKKGGNLQYGTNVISLTQLLIWPILWKINWVQKKWIQFARREKSENKRAKKKKKKTIGKRKKKGRRHKKLTCINSKLYTTIEHIYSHQKMKKNRDASGRYASFIHLPPLPLLYRISKSCGRRHE